jgi:hypothetical protein
VYDRRLSCEYRVAARTSSHLASWVVHLRTNVVLEIKDLVSSGQILLVLLNIITLFDLDDTVCQWYRSSNYG